jgi:hypothetical protein
MSVSAVDAKMQTIRTSDPNKEASLVPLLASPASPYLLDILVYIKKNSSKSDHNQDHPHNRSNNQTGHIRKGVGSMIAYYEHLRAYAQDYR